MHFVVMIFIWEASAADTCRVVDLLPVPISEADHYCHRMGQIAYHRGYAEECENRTVEIRKLIRKRLTGEQLAELERLFIIERSYHVFYNDEMQRRLQISPEQMDEIVNGTLNLSRKRPGLTHPQNLAFDDVILHEVVYLHLTEQQREAYKKMVRKRRKPVLTHEKLSP